MSPLAAVTRVAALAAVVCASATASTDSFMTSEDSAQRVPPGYRQVAAEQRIPAALLYAIALTESGYGPAAGANPRPWPWTLNIRGKGHYYPSFAAAAQALTATLHQGETAVDVGLMQIHWRYHHAALGTVHRALDPYHNLRVAAQILADCYRQRTDWWSAAGCYHAPNNPALAERYQARVQRHWRALRPDV